VAENTASVVVHLDGKRACEILPGGAIEIRHDVLADVGQRGDESIFAWKLRKATAAAQRRRQIAAQLGRLAIALLLEDAGG
jgi:hypothetical protein